jgi:hypothetical protein
MVVVLACGSSGRDDGTATTNGSGITLTVGTGATEGGDDSADEEGVLDVAMGETGAADEGGEGGECPCENVLDGIYVLHSEDPPAVWFYDPPANQFSMIGSLGCPAAFGATANSMAIDRQGNATFNFYTIGPTTNTGRMYRAPLTNLGGCQDLGYDAQGSWFLMGMGYSVNGNGSSCDTLFVYNSDQYIDYPDFTPGGSQLARWDEAAIDKQVIGPTAYPVGELTGTGDGRLFAFATVAMNQSVLVQLDKSDGSELESTPLQGLDITNAFAFAFWGGDVYFFTETTPGATNSKVTKLDYDENEGGGLSVVNQNAGIHIAGAGVSTCASFTPPS